MYSPASIMYKMHPGSRKSTEIVFKCVAHGANTCQSLRHVVPCVSNLDVAVHQVTTSNEHH